MHFLTPGGLFDRVANLSRGRIRASLTGWRDSRREVSVGGIVVPHRTWRSDVLYARFAAPWFVVVAAHGVGVCTPDDGPSRVPKHLTRALRVVDGSVGRAPLIRRYGRFGILVLRRR